MFMKGTLQLFETGVMNYLKDNFEGNFIPAITEAETMVLGAGQVLLVFAVISLALVVSFVIFIAECVYFVRLNRKIVNLTSTAKFKEPTNK